MNKLEAVKKKLDFLEGQGVCAALSGKDTPQVFVHGVLKRNAYDQCWSVFSRPYPGEVASCAIFYLHQVESVLGNSIYLKL